ncbi:MAG: NUDIX domain-containing protein [Pseudomonadota bacterium]|nr:MAG: NUDIX domain-containing protein [Pseudomonadota bacterium]
MKARTLSAGAVVVRWRDNVPHFLLLRAYNYWDFPKGEVEAGESPLDAARREIEEETSLCDLEFPWGTAYRETPVYGRGKIARFYLARSDRGAVALPFNPSLGRPEHHEFRWLPFSEARELLVERLQAILDWASQVVTAMPAASD